LNPTQFGSRVAQDLLLPVPRIHPLEAHLDATMEWLCVAQDRQGDGGVALRYSLIKGWQPSYPETTGYIIPTFLTYSALTGKRGFAERALRMADWELSVQNADGSINGGPVGSGYAGFVFDTGQVIFGLIAAHRATNAAKYLEGAVRAGRWIVQVQDKDGMWIKHAFHGIPHTYYTRVAWALAELGVHTGERMFSEAARRNADWALTKQQPNGWFDCTGFTTQSHVAPFTHTIAYTLEGLLETGALLARQEYVEAVARSADSLCKTVFENGYCHGTYDRDWTSGVRFACLTGSAQIALVLLRLHEMNARTDYLATARAMNRFLRERQTLTGAVEVRGAVAGSYPIWGKYQRFAYPNWAAKFFADSLMLEKKIGV